jgi:hypothetical protein
MTAEYQISNHLDHVFAGTDTLRTNSCSLYPLTITHSPVSSIAGVKEHIDQTSRCAMDYGHCSYSPRCMS